MAKQNFESKHPVSLLGELSAKRKFGAPLYELVMQEGPSHQRQFLYSVRILNILSIDILILHKIPYSIDSIHCNILSFRFMVNFSGNNQRSGISAQCNESQ